MSIPESGYTEDVYIVIPCYNEAPIIAEVVNSLKMHFKNIVVINDGSTDNTKEILEQLDVIHLRHPLNLGQGAAIFTGFEYLKRKTKAKALVTFDADGQHSVADAVAFADEILKCPEDIIFGSRFLPKKLEISFVKRIVLKSVMMLTNIITGMDLTDTHNGIKAFKIGALSRLQTNLYRSAFETELILNVAKSELSYKELPSVIEYTEYSKKKGQKLSNGFIVLEDLARLVFKRWY